ncbi:MAG: response regulator, partial [Chthoniobacteraceae bacterium]
TATSEPGVGSTFTIFLPPATVPAAEPARVVEPKTPRGSGEAVLVVDDELIVSEVAATLLRRLGYHPHICHSGERALEILQADPGSFALIFTDLNMPRLTGLDLIRALREAGDSTPCVLTTGFIGSGATEDEARALGVSGIVEKPFTERTLGLAINTALAKTRPPASVSTSAP